MGGFGKTTRYAIAILVVMAGGFWTSVTFLGENWSDQGHYVLALLNMLLLIVLSAVLLLVVFKLVGVLWQKLVERKAGQMEADDTDPQE